MYVIVYKEVPFTMDLNSLHTKRDVLLCSHYEKMVVIDQKVAFLGGIDLCFGRWDDEYMR